MEIGRYISGLANAAALHGQPAAYLVWGVQDGTHAVVGTHFRPRSAKKGNENLEAWLARMVEPRPHLLFHEGSAGGQAVVVLEIPPASRMPVAFERERHVRVGTYLKPLRDYPEKERKLWELLKSTSFEEGICLEGVDSNDLLNNLLDYPAYFHLTGTPLPTGADGILERLAAENLIRTKGQGRFDVTNLGGILFARDLTRFPRLARKSLRIIHYRGTSRVETIREQERSQGYERGSGIDKVIAKVEEFQLPAPNFTVLEDNTRAVLFSPRNYRDMERADRVRACYQHACLQWVSGQSMTNATLRHRLGIDPKNYPMASRVIKDALGADLIKPMNPDAPPGVGARYLPYWA